MRYLSVCSGIEAASVAWSHLGWHAAGFSEIEPFPCSVLQHRFPDVKNYGDMTRFEEWDIGPVDVLVGGTPCQSFSIAGLRGGLDDQRGNLALVYCRILQAYRPRWFVWENVPGVLSSSGGRDFGSILGAMAELGYSFAWRILDAQYFGVPQRRRRVFIVGHLGDWRRPAAVLFEPGCVRRDPEKSGKAGKNVAALTATGVGTCGADDNQGQAGHLIAHLLRGEGFDASEDGTGRGTPLVTVPSITSHYGRGVDSDCTSPLVSSTGAIAHCLNAGGMGRQDYETETMVVAFNSKTDAADFGATSATLRAMNHAGSHANAGGQIAIAFSGRDRGDDGRGYCREPNITGPITETVDATKPPRIAGPTTGVRRLTPLECERLQGFPDHWTLVPHRGKPAADGPRYKAIGNSMAVPIMRWIGERIEEFNNREMR